MQYLIENELMESVKTYNGSTDLRKNCRYIKGEYYIKNKDCFLINDKWYRVNSGHIIFDYELKQWVLKSNTYLCTGIVSINPDCTIIERGSFSPNSDNNVVLMTGTGDLETVIDFRILDSNDQIEEGVNGVYYFKKYKKTMGSQFSTKLKPNKDRFYSFPFNYGSDELIPVFREEFERKFVGDPLLSNAYVHLEDYTFGVEFETERGAIPERFLKPNGLIACRDGSIAGFEYTTIPLQGASGIQAIKKSCDLLHKYCSCSPNEALHIHVGGYPKTVKNVASIFRLGLLLEKEIYSMFPYFYIDTSQFKRKSYCGPLPPIGKDLTSPTEIMSDLYQYLSNGQTFTRFPTGVHPMDRSGQHKWEVSPRYVWLNTIPLIWGTRGTVEFRCHTPTLNSQKVINWLFIVIAIIQYAKKHMRLLTTTKFANLPKVTLKEVLLSAYPTKISSILIDYIEARKAHYKDKCDILGESEIFSDNNDNIPIFDLKSFI